MGLYDTFQTDSDLEKEGVWIDYGDFRVRIGHAGGSNSRYMKYAEKKLKPIRRAMEVGAISNERSQAIMTDIYANSIVFDWETKIDGEWVQGIEGPDGGLLDFNEENVKKTLQALPKLFSDLQQMADSISNFRRQNVEADSGN